MSNSVSTISPVEGSAYVEREYAAAEDIQSALKYAKNSQQDWRKIPEGGLTAAIFTKDIDTGIELGQQIETGTFFINRCDYLDPELAWTGVKNSGHGYTLSVIGYEAVTRPKSFHIKTDL